MKLRRGFTLVELLIVIAIIMIMAAVGISSLGSGTKAARESAALREIHTLLGAQAQYMAAHGRYATSLTELGPPEMLVSKAMARGEKNGYRYVLSPAAGGFAITAVPARYDVTGRYSYYTDVSGIIRRHKGPEPATADSPELE